MGDTGLEHLSKTSGETGVAVQSGAESGAVDAAGGLIDPDLQVIIDAWPGLSEVVRSELLAIVRANGDQRV